MLTNECYNLCVWKLHTHTELIFLNTAVIFKDQQHKPKTACSRTVILVYKLYITIIMIIIII